MAKLWLPVIFWAAIILSSSNDHFSAKHSEGWLARIFGRPVPHMVNVVFRKLAGHALFYGILGGLAWRADRRIAVSLGVVLLVATTDEVHQTFTRQRSGAVHDVVIDVCAAAFVVWILRTRGWPARE
ncbi:MAG: VanZ family protein [Acidobacteriota bacterium]|nr:VanZ family protein [Acidobacteriota bacterium]